MTEVTDNQKDLTLQVFKKNTKMIYIRSLLKEYYNRHKENQSIDLTPDTLCIQECKTNIHLTLLLSFARPIYFNDNLI